MGQELINELGNKYGSLTVIELTKDKNGRTAWLCQCDCGNKKIVRGSDLRKNKITHCSRSCPCKTNGNFINEKGNKYGYLTVLYQAPNSESGRVQWHCKCQCGKEIDVLAESLRKGLTKSCGCKSLELLSESKSLDLTNQQFGLLIPIEKLPIPAKEGEGNYWRCKCLCGCGREDIILPTRRLTSQNTQSCGQNRKSHGEIAIENFLKNKNISYKSEYTFKDFYAGKENNKFRYDFAIFKNEQLFCLIEYDGQQHFYPINHFGGQEGFLKIQEYDNLKNSYCKNHNILLLRIKYDENIDEKLEIFLKEHNF